MVNGDAALIALLSLFLNNRDIVHLGAGIVFSREEDMKLVFDIGLILNYY